MQRSKGTPATHVLAYSECRDVIDQMASTIKSDVFGVETDESFKSSIASVYQTFDGQEFYPTLEEKARTSCTLW